MEYKNENRTETSAEVSDKNDIVSKNEDIVTRRIPSVESLQPQNSEENKIKTIYTHYSDKSFRNTFSIARTFNKKCPGTNDSSESMCVTCTIFLEKVRDFVRLLWKDRSQRLDNLMENFNTTDVRKFKCKGYIQRTVFSNPSDYAHVSQRVIEILNKINKLSEDWNDRKLEVSKLVSNFKMTCSKFYDVYMKASETGLATYLHETTENVGTSKLTEIKESDKRKISDVFQSGHKSPEITFVPNPTKFDEALEENEISDLNLKKIRRIHNETKSDYILNKYVNKSVICKNENSISNVQSPSTSADNFNLHQSRLFGDEMSLSLSSCEESRPVSTFEKFNEENVYFKPLKIIKNKITEYIHYDLSFRDLRQQCFGSTANPNRYLFISSFSATEPILKSVEFMASSLSTNSEKEKEVSEVPKQAKDVLNYIMRDFYNRMDYVCQEFNKNLQLYFDEKLNYNEAYAQYLNECIDLICSGESFPSICNKIT